MREAVGPDGADHWLAGQFAVVWIAVHPDRRGRGLGRALLERLLAGAGTERAWLITHDLDTPARALYRSLGFQELGRGPLGWHDAERVVLGAELPTPVAAAGRHGRLTRTRRCRVPRWGRLPRQRDGAARAAVHSCPTAVGPSGQFWRFSKMPAAPWPPPTHMVTMP